MRTAFPGKKGGTARFRRVQEPSFWDTSSLFYIANQHRTANQNQRTPFRLGWSGGEDWKKGSLPACTYGGCVREGGGENAREKLQQPPPPYAREQAGQLREACVLEGGGRHVGRHNGAEKNRGGRQISTLALREEGGNTIGKKSRRKKNVNCAFPPEWAPFAPAIKTPVLPPPSRGPPPAQVFTRNPRRSCRRPAAPPPPPAPSRVTRLSLFHPPPPSPRQPPAPAGRALLQLAVQLQAGRQKRGRR